MLRILFGIILLCNNLHRGRTQSSDSSSSFVEEQLTDNDGTTQTHIFREAIPFLSSRSDVTMRNRPDDHYIHEVIFVIQSRNMGELTQLVDDVSDPGSANYGQHMTRDQVVELTSDPISFASVSAYLQANDASVVSVSSGEEYITAQAPISVWNKLFNTSFHIFQQTHRDGNVSEVVRAEEYWMPREIHSHVLCAMNIVEMPIIQNRWHSSAIEVESTKSRRLEIIGELHEYLVTPARLRIYYNMSNSAGNSLSTQVVFAGNHDYFSPLSLRYFQGNVSMQPYQPAIIEVDDGHATDDPSIPEGKLAEGNLDMQYIMAMSPGSPTTYWHYNQGIARFIRDLAGKPKPSLVVSISYALTERMMTRSEYSIYEEWIVKASAMGVTVFTASGDQGALGDAFNGMCAYNPTFPGTNPYTVSVGATTVRVHIGQENALFGYFSLVGFDPRYTYS